MQNIVFYVAANEPLGTVKDYANAKIVAAPTMVLGAACQLRMRLFANAEGPDAYPLTELAAVTSWQWQMDTDFTAATTRKIEADNGDIAVASVTVEIDEEEYTYTEITIPISNMLTAELVAMMNGVESASIAGELCGFDGTGALVFILQVKGFTVRGRISDTGTPTELPVEYLTEAQVRALVNGGFDVVFCETASTTAADWHSTQTAADRYMKFRLAGDASAAWSSPVGLVVGPQGTAGQSCYAYIAWATNTQGDGFTMDVQERTTAHKYMGILITSTAIVTPDEEDFSGLWVKVVGDDGQGVGDMTKAVYDTNDDGKVNEADHAANADAVPWSGITGKPGSFTPAAHSHAAADISDPVRLAMYSENTCRTLYLNKPVLREGNRQSGALTIAFTAVKTAPDGSSYTGQSGDCLTWEYHVPASGEITGITIGNNNCTMAGVNIPESLPLLNGNYTTHVFTVRAMHKSGATNSLLILVNYAYSYEE